MCEGRLLKAEGVSIFVFAGISVVVVLFERGWLSLVSSEEDDKYKVTKLIL